MTPMVHLLLWLLLSAIPATRPAATAPAANAPDLSAAVLVPVQKVEGPDSVQVLRDGGVVGVRLAGVAYPQQETAARDAAADFLRQMLTGEKVWLVPAGPPQASDGWYLYRWPDKLFVNLELVRQGYADAAAQPGAPAATGQAMVYWRDLARQQRKGVWAAGAESAGRAAGAAPPSDQSRASGGRATASRPAISPAPQQADASDRSVVYVTAHGKKYHRANCRSLRSGSKGMSLADARKTYEPCKQCNPPQ